MKLVNHISFKRLIIVSLIFTTIACNFTQTLPPQVNNKADSIFNALKAANQFEEINIQEKKTSGSGDNSTVLTIRLYNGKNLPVGDTAIKAFGKTIAIKIKPALKNPAEFTGYAVLFCTRVVDGMSTTTNYTGYDYTPAEIK